MPPQTVLLSYDYDDLTQIFAFSEKAFDFYVFNDSCFVHDKFISWQPSKSNTLQSGYCSWMQFITFEYIYTIIVLFK